MPSWTTVDTRGTGYEKVFSPKAWKNCLYWQSYSAFRNSDRCGHSPMMAKISGASTTCRSAFAGSAKLTKLVLNPCRKK
jgi:hypothetical protein